MTIDSIELVETIGPTNEADAPVKRGRGRPRKDGTSAQPRAQQPPPDPAAHCGKVQLVPIDEIKIGERHRNDLGDLMGLASSIEKFGLLQPIGITPERELVFGLRRVAAYRVLGKGQIPARIVRISDLVQVEYDENELRKEFTVSERVAIRETLERKGAGRPSENRQDLVDKDEAARLAGFANRETARQATSVVHHGTPELVEAMDKSEVSIDAAAQIAKQPAEEQNRVLGLPKTERRAAVRKMRAAPAKPAPEKTTLLLFHIPPTAPSEWTAAVAEKEPALPPSASVTETEETVNDLVSATDDVEHQFRYLVTTLEVAQLHRLIAMLQQHLESISSTGLDGTVAPMSQTSEAINNAA